MLRRCGVALYKIPKAYDYAKPRPVIRKTRSWRGLMQVRFDDTEADRKSMMKHAFIWAPIRVTTTGVLAAAWMYFYLGHDQFMFQMFGYESEAMVEGRVNQVPEHIWEDLLSCDRGSNSNLRKFEKDNHALREFDVFQKKDDGTPAMIHDRTAPWVEERD